MHIYAFDYQRDSVSTSESLENVHETRNRFFHAVINFVVQAAGLLTVLPRTNIRHLMTEYGPFCIDVMPRTNAGCL